MECCRCMDDASANQTPPFAAPRLNRVTCTHCTQNVDTKTVPKAPPSRMSRAPLYCTRFVILHCHLSRAAFCCCYIHVYTVLYCICPASAFGKHFRLHLSYTTIILSWFRVLVTQRIIQHSTKSCDTVPLLCFNFWNRHTSHITHGLYMLCLQKASLLYYHAMACIYSMVV